MAIVLLIGFVTSLPIYGFRFRPSVFGMAVTDTATARKGLWFRVSGLG
jgi:hypothetical protein